MGTVLVEEQQTQQDLLVAAVVEMGTLGQVPQAQEAQEVLAVQVLDQLILPLWFLVVEEAVEERDKRAERDLVQAVRVERVEELYSWRALLTV